MRVVAGEHLVVLCLLHHHHLVHALSAAIILQPVLFNISVACIFFLTNNRVVATIDMFSSVISQLREPSSFLVDLLWEGVENWKALCPWSLVLISLLGLRRLTSWFMALYCLLNVGSMCPRIGGILLAIFILQVEGMRQARESKVGREYG